jgi:hypothetical protein
MDTETLALLIIHGLAALHFSNKTLDKLTTNACYKNFEFQL